MSISTRYVDAENKRQDILMRIERAFEPVSIVVDDVSDQHKGHKAWREEGGTHYNITIVSDKFAYINRVKRHQMLYDLFRHELQNGDIHAISAKLLTPSEGM